MGEGEESHSHNGDEETPVEEREAVGLYIPSHDLRDIPVDQQLLRRAN